MKIGNSSTLAQKKTVTSYYRSRNGHLRVLCSFNSSRDQDNEVKNETELVLSSLGAHAGVSELFLHVTSKAVEFLNSVSKQCWLQSIPYYHCSRVEIHRFESMHIS